MCRTWGSPLEQGPMIWTGIGRYQEGSDDVDIVLSLDPLQPLLIVGCGFLTV